MSKDMRWFSDITRTEIFFTAYLHMAIEENRCGMQTLLSRKGIPGAIFDSSFEFCFFRDLHFNGVISIHDAVKMANNIITKSPENLYDRKKISLKSLYKLTFDNILRLEDNSLVIIEAKVQQGFNERQIKDLLLTAELIRQMGLAEKVYLVGLHSSYYTPKDTTLNGNGIIDVTWKEIANYLGDKNRLFSKADEIYVKKADVTAEMHDLEVLTAHHE